MRRAAVLAFAAASSGVGARVVVALVLLGGVEVRAVHRLHVLPQGRRVGVALGAARGLAHVRFLRRERGR